MKIKKILLKGLPKGVEPVFIGMKPFYFQILLL